MSRTNRGTTSQTEVRASDLDYSRDRSPQGTGGTTRYGSRSPTKYGSRSPTRFSDLGRTSRGRDIGTTETYTGGYRGTSGGRFSDLGRTSRDRTGSTSGGRFSDLGTGERSRERDRDNTGGSYGGSNRYGTNGHGRDRSTGAGGYALEYGALPSVGDRITIKYDGRDYICRVSDYVKGEYGDVARCQLDTSVRVDGISHSILHLVPSVDGYAVREFLRGRTTISNL